MDIQRLEDFCDGDMAQVHDLFSAYTEQSRVYLADLKTAVKGNNAAETRRLAHACCGSSAQCGVQRLAAILGELEQQAMDKRMDRAQALLNAAELEFARALEFVEGWLAGRQTGV